MMTSWHGTVPACRGQRLYALLTPGRDMLHTWWQHRGERHNLRSLWHLDDRLLAAIGLHRGSVAWEGRRPFWKP